jgi:lipid-binding SYLF domain-containing protein
MNTQRLCVFAFVTLLWSVGAMSTERSPGPNAAERQKITEDSRRVLSRLYESAPGSRELVASARGLLIFPTVLSAGETTGGQYGEGELLVDGKALALYSATGFDLAPQHGTKSRAFLVLFFTQDALAGFRASEAWTVGTEAATALKRTASGSIDPQTASTAVVGFVVTSAGVAVDPSIEGIKVRRLP